jgi:hypothetical protein
VKKVQIVEREFPLENTLVYLGRGVLSKSEDLLPPRHNDQVTQRLITVICPLPPAPYVFANGNITLKVLPAPFVLSTSIRPL